MGRKGGLRQLLPVIERYEKFFSLFQDFRGYVDFFFLQDLVNEDYTEVRFFLPFDDFKTPAIPQNKEEYFEHRINAIEFLEARNRRINEWASNNLKANQTGDDNSK